MDERVINGKICPYCDCETKLVRGDYIYPIVKNGVRPKYVDKFYYVCILNKNHYVGTYGDNKRSLGRVADFELRKLKNQGHNIFDPLWKDEDYFKSRKEAYEWLSKKMKLPLELTHFGMFNNEQCKMAVKYCNELRQNKKRNFIKKVLSYLGKIIKL
ncbi:MAG: zinc-finger-containing protein [Flavobacteriaceae bacterium]|nr:zinc-finger-containing protein [Flavobacteriaceae bacterium]